MIKKYKWDLYLVIVTLFWGLGYVWSSVTLREMSPYMFTFARYGLASLFLLPVVFFVNRFKNLDKEIIFAGAIIGITMGIGAVIQNVGLLYTTPSKSGFLTGFTVILVPVFVAVMNKKLPDKMTIAGIIVAMMGLSVISLDFKNLDLTLNKGDILTLIATLFFAINLLVIHKYSKGKDILLLSSVEFFFISISGFIPWLFAERTIGNYSSVTIISLLLAVFLCTMLAFSLQNYAVPKTDPTHASVIFLLEPVFCAIFSVFIGDIIKPSSLVGGILIIVGMLITNLSNVNE